MNLKKKYNPTTQLNQHHFSERCFLLLLRCGVRGDEAVDVLIHFQKPSDVLAGLGRGVGVVVHLEHIDEALREVNRRARLHHVVHRGRTAGLRELLDGGLDLVVHAFPVAGIVVLGVPLARVIVNVTAGVDSAVGITTTNLGGHARDGAEGDQF